jgi:hypothetical protein
MLYATLPATALVVYGSLHHPLSRPPTCTQFLELEGNRLYILANSKYTRLKSSNLELMETLALLKPDVLRAGKDREVTQVC